MKNNTLLLITLFIIGFVCGICFDIPVTKQHKQTNVTTEWSETKKDSIIDAYEWYFLSVEELLDTLDNRYDWVDAYDPEEYYYWVNKLDSLY